MTATWKIAWRFLLKGTEKGTLSPMTVFVWLAVGVGVAAMSVLLSVMYGFEGALRDRVLTAFPHVMVKSSNENVLVEDSKTTTEMFSHIQGVESVLPYLENEMIFQSDYRTVGGVVRGIHFENLSTLRKHITKGEVPNKEGEQAEVVVGSELVHRLGLAVGDEIRIISPLKKSGIMGMAPEGHRFKISGIYSSGHYEFDQQYVFMLMEDAQDLLSVNGKISGYHFWAKNIDQSESMLKAIQEVMPPNLQAVSWRVFNQALFDSLRLEQFSMSLILNFAVIIAVMNIIITLMMHVAHKKRNIGILRAIGASKKQIQNIFMLQGMMMGGIGLLIGIVLSTVLIVYLKFFSTIQLPEIYYDRTIPVEVRPFSMVMIVVVACVMIFFATLYPARKAASLDPVEAIRE